MSTTSAPAIDINVFPPEERERYAAASPMEKARILGVGSEAWHMGWIRTGEFLKGVGDGLNPWTKSGLDSGPVALRLTSKDNPYV